MFILTIVIWLGFELHLGDGGTLCNVDVDIDCFPFYKCTDYPACECSNGTVLRNGTCSGVCSLFCLILCFSVHAQQIHRV